MKIIKLSIRNFLGIKDAEIAPGEITILSGKNGQGKTSVLKAIEAAFRGATPAVIHKGSERAEIIVDLEEIRVTRVITPKAQKVEVTNADNFKRSTPQAFLDGLLGNFAFNPLAFLLADAKARREYLLKALPLTVTSEDVNSIAGEDLPIPPEGHALEMYERAHRYFYERRTEANRVVKQKELAAKEARSRLPEGFRPDGEIVGKLDSNARESIRVRESLAALRAKAKASEDAARMRATLEGRIERNRAAIEQARATLAAEKAPDIAGLRSKVEDLRLQLRAAEEALQAGVSARANQDRLREDVASMERGIAQDQETFEGLPGPFDTSGIREEEARLSVLDAQASALGLVAAHMKTWEEAAALGKQAQEARERSEKIEEMVVLFGKTLPATALTVAEFPVKDLSIDGDRILVCDVPIDQLSTSEQIAVTLSIARSLAKQGLPLICIDGIERLDEEAFSEFIQQAKGDGFQYFVTRVGTPQEGELEIAGGKVVA